MSRQIEPSEWLHESAPDLVAALQPVMVAESEEERDALFRFRYSIYVDELGRKLGNADHASRRVHDAEDDKDYTLLLYTLGRDGTVTGTARLRHWRAGAVNAKDWDTFSMERFPGLERLGTCEWGRLMVKPDERGQRLLVSLAVALAQLSIERGVDVGFINCAPGLVRHYRRLGFRAYAGRVVATPDGVEVPLVMFLSDVAYMQQVGSFLAPLADPRYGPDGRAALSLEPFAHLLATDAVPVQVDREAVWDRVSLLRATASPRPGVLNALTDETVRKLSDGGFLMSVPAGLLLTEKDLSQREIFVILDGTFEVRNGDRRLRVIGPDDVVGEIGFFGTLGRRSASVQAMTDGQVLVIRRHFLDELRKHDPACAADILFQLARALADRVYTPGD